MSVSTYQVERDETVFILKITGELDASNYREVMDKAQEAHAAGAQYLLIDLSQLRFMSSTGLALLHSMTLMMQNVGAPDVERVKLLDPQPNVLSLLEKTGFSEMYEIFKDQETALASCGN